MFYIIMGLVILITIIIAIVNIKNGKKFSIVTLFFGVLIVAIFIIYMIKNWAFWLN